MAIHRGIQSAVFYYLSCAPCAEARYRKKRKEERARGRLERELLEAENPNLYRQPSPSSTNPHWQSEIALGPALAVRGRKKNAAAGGKGRQTTYRITENTSADQSSIDLPRRDVDKDPNDSRWNFRVYQRQDEELWGSASNDDAASSYAGSLAKPPKALTKSSTAYHSYRNPPLNDMHPATVTKISSPEEVKWMLQPPPVAEVMQGKERVSRSRSDSGGSRMMNSSSASLARQLSSRLVQNKLKLLETATPTPMSRESSSRTGNGPYGQRHDRSATTSQRDFAISPPSIDPMEIRMPSPVSIPQESDEVDDAHRRESVAPEILSTSQSNTSASRPQLSTIHSNSEETSNRPRFDGKSSSSVSKENRLPTPPQSRDEALYSPARSALQFPYVISDTSIMVGGDATPRSLNGKVIRTRTAPDVKDDSQRQLGHRHEPSEDLVMLRPELLDSWYTPEFELGKWVHETTKREVKQRWSMDL